jgi:ribosomal protein L29
MNGYVEKPVEMDALKEEIARVLGVKNLGSVH